MQGARGNQEAPQWMVKKFPHRKRGKEGVLATCLLSSLLGVLSLSPSLFVLVSVFLMRLSLQVHCWDVSPSVPRALCPCLCAACSLSVSPRCLLPCLSGSVSFGLHLSLPPSLLPPPLLFLSEQEEACEALRFPSRPPPPPPVPPQVFFSAPYSRQIKCTQLLPAETGLNCTPVAMAIPDDLRGWNVALPISLLGPPGCTALLGPELTPRGTLVGQQGGLKCLPPSTSVLVTPRDILGIQSDNAHTPGQGRGIPLPPA